MSLQDNVPGTRERYFLLPGGSNPQPRVQLTGLNYSHLISLMEMELLNNLIPVKEHLFWLPPTTSKAGRILLRVSLISAECLKGTFTALVCRPHASGPELQLSNFWANQGGRGSSGSSGSLEPSSEEVADPHQQRALCPSPPRPPGLYLMTQLCLLLLSSQNCFEFC